MTIDRFKLAASGSLHEKPGDFAALIDRDQKTVFVPTAIFNAATGVTGNRHNPELVDFITAALWTPSAMAAALDWRTSDALHAGQTLRAQIESNGFTVPDVQDYPMRTLPPRP